MKVKNACGCWTKFWQTLTRWELVSWAIYFLQFNQVVAQSQISHLFVPDPRQWKFPFHWENQNNWLHLHGGFRHFQINQFWKFKSCWCSRRLCVCFAATNQTCQRALFQQLQNENRWDKIFFATSPRPLYTSITTFSSCSPLLLLLLFFPFLVVVVTSSSISSCCRLSPSVHPLSSPFPPSLPPQASTLVTLWRAWSVLENHSSISGGTRSTWPVACTLQVYRTGFRWTCRNVRCKNVMKLVLSP